MTAQQIWTQRRSNTDYERVNDHRSPFERDKARILHSAAFRRLQAKTQILTVGQNDFYRTRLTHSLEVSQVGSGLLAQLQRKFPEQCQQLALDDKLIESLCLAHDIGHPPFGHGGEVALHYMMRNDGGFEGNGQTLRLLAVLEPYTEHFGMNMTRRTLLGLLKYPNTIGRLHAKSQPAQHQRFFEADQWKPPKGVFDDDQGVLDWIFAGLSEQDARYFQSFDTPDDPRLHSKTRFKSLDASIMEIADDIAYGVHDLEDAIVVGNIPKELWYDEAIAQFKALDDPSIYRLTAVVSEKLFDEHHLRKEAIGLLVNVLITAVELYQTDARFDSELLRYNAKLGEAQQHILEVLKRFVFEYVIKKPEIQQTRFKGQQIVMDLFAAFASDPQVLLPLNTRKRWLSAQDSGQNPTRVICDYISGMTDEYAAKMHQRLFVA